METQHKLIAFLNDTKEEISSPTNKKHHDVFSTRDKENDSIFEKPFQCDHCKKLFSRKNALVVHMTHVHMKNEKLLKCDTSPKYLKTHKLTLSHTLALECPFCTKRFKTKKHLSNHMKIHLKKPFECRYCLKGYLSKRDLDDHETMHTGAKPHLCLICCKQFSRKKTLYSHIKIHEENKKHECLICKKKFTNSSYLRIHFRSHTGN